MGASSDSDTPEDDLDAKRKYIRDKVIFTREALKGNAMMYVYEDPDHRIHVSDLAILVMELLEAGLTREKAKAELEANQKKKELMERRTQKTNSVYVPSPGIKNSSKMTEFGLNKLEKLSETDESDFYEDSKCHNIELPMPEVMEDGIEVGKSTLEHEHKLPDVGF